MADDDAVQVQIGDGTQGSKILPGMDAQEDGQGEENVFSRSSAAKRQPEDEEAVRWAALQKLPTYDRVRKTLFKTVEANGNALTEEVDVTQLSHQDRKKLMSKILKETEEDNEHLLLKLRNRIDRVGIELPKIEVRFEHLDICAQVHVGSRALPTLPNFLLTLAETLLSKLHLSTIKKTTLNILHDVSGIIKPGRITLLLGPPGAGKSTLLLALAGRLSESLEASGKVTYNGHEMHEFVPQRTAAYISQQDLQLGELTVRETFDFSSQCQGVGPASDMLKELLRREKEVGIFPDADVDMFMKATAVQGQETSLVTDYMLKILDLEICADILVGDEMRRGISGGQKKRANTGEMMVGPAKAVFMDEISTGLDSTTAYRIVKCLSQSVHVMESTMVVSLLQPAPETFELFDDLILLSEGQIVYQGPRDLVTDFFESMGFKCPERKAVADFLQEVTSRKDQQQYWYNRSVPYRYVSVKAFAEGFAKFYVGEKLDQELGVPFEKGKSHPAALVTQKYALSNWELFQACFTREKLLMKRTKVVYIFRIVQICLVSTITMSVFLRTSLHPDSVTSGGVYLGELFFALVNIMFSGLIEMALIISRLPVYYKQRDLYFYPAWSFALPVYILRLPVSVYESFLWVAITYWTIGFAPEASRFFRQWLVLVAMHQMALGLFRSIASIARLLIIAQAFGAFGLILVVTLGGFVVSRSTHVALLLFD